MKLTYKKFLSILLILFVIINCISMPVYASVSVSENAVTKLDAALAEQIAIVDKNEKIHVSVWFDDIDCTSVENEMQQQLEVAIKNKKLGKEITKILNNDLQMEEVIALSESLNNQEVQTAVEMRRKIVSELQIENNMEIFEELFPRTKWSWFNRVKIEQPEVIYSCVLAPNMELYLTKEQIYDIIDSSKVNAIYYISEEENNGLEEPIVSSGANDFEGYSTACFETTGITYMRDTLGKTGKNIKIGIFDISHPYYGKSYFAHKELNRDFFMNPECLLPSSGKHPNSVACIIAGKTDTYKGAVPDATLYTTDDIVVGGYKRAVEWLVADCGVNVVNMSRNVGSDGFSNRGDAAVWFDHIAVQHQTTIVMSAGNIGVSGVTSPKMSYNTIVVGCIDNNNTVTRNDDFLAAYSSWSDDEESMVKPDILAPGHNLITPATEAPDMALYRSGTSMAAPLVTGAVAQLMEMYPVLKTKPQLVKAILLAGCEGFTTTSNMNNTNAALNRKYGAGELNVRNSRLIMLQNGQCSETNSSIKKVTVTNANVPLRFALTWLANVSFADGVSHVDGQRRSRNTFLKLKITCPNGDVYTSFNVYTNIQLVEIPKAKVATGQYKIEVTRHGPIDFVVDYSVAVLNGRSLTNYV